MTFFAHGRAFKKNPSGLCKYDKWNFRPQIAPILHFDQVNTGWIRGLLCVKATLEKAKGGFLSESVIRFSNLPIFPKKYPELEI